MPLSSEQKTALVTALRSGDYTQTRGRLCRFEDYIPCRLDSGDSPPKVVPAGHCCLGVAAIVFGFEIDPENGNAIRPKGSNGSFGAYTWMRDYIEHDHRAKMIEMNDGARLNFNQIADWVEQNL